MRLLLCLSVIFFVEVGNLHAQGEEEAAVDYNIHMCKLPATPNILDYLEAAMPYVYSEQGVVKSALEAARGADTRDMAVAEKIVDLRNGYVSVEIGWNEDAQHAEACYWRMNDPGDGHQRVLLGIYYWWPPEETSILFFEIDRTAGTVQAVPHPYSLPSFLDESSIQYKLPRTDKTIKGETYQMYAADGSPLPIESSPLQIELTFNGTSFDTKIIGLAKEISAFPVLNENESEIDIYRDGDVFTRIVESDAE